MSKKCVKCGYVRQAIDIAPDYECPKCGVIYAKAESTAAQRSVQKSEPREEKNAAPSIKDLPLPDIDSWRIVLYQDGNAVETKLKRLYATHGPFVIDDNRLDRLERVEIVRDASTVTTHSTSEGETSTKTGSLATRAVVGNMVAGPAGMIVGAGSAKIKTVTEAISKQSVNVDIYLSLHFRNVPSPVTVQVFSEEAFQQVIASQGSAEWSQPDLERARNESHAWEVEKERRVNIQKMGQKKDKIAFSAIALLALIYLFSLLVFRSNYSYGSAVIVSIIIVPTIMTLFFLRVFPRLIYTAFILGPIIGVVTTGLVVPTEEVRQKERHSYLSSLVEAGNVATIEKELAKEGASQDSYNGYLGIAVSKGDSRMAQLFLNKGANPNRWGLLCDAVESANIEIIEVLLSAGASADIKCANDSLLYKAKIKSQIANDTRIFDVIKPHVKEDTTRREQYADNARKELNIDLPSCSDLNTYARKVRGNDIFEAAEIMQAAKREGRCR